MLPKWGPYELQSELGRGGMGVVYQAFDHDLRRKVAIKVLGDHYSGDPKLVERFFREARGMASLNHPNVIQIHFIGTQDEKPYFVMEYVEGETLEQWISREGHLSLARAAEVVLETACGLRAAHAAGIIHRDIKPTNIMISQDGSVKVADFGIARVPEGEHRLTGTGQFLGTPGYLAPEVCEGKPADERSDIFSLGLVYFEMLTGRMPFEAESPYGMIQQVVAARIPDVRRINKQVDQQSQELLKRMVMRDCNRRFPDCESLIAAFKAYLADVAKTKPDCLKKTVASEVPEEPPVADATLTHSLLTDPLVPEPTSFPIEPPLGPEQNGSRRHKPAILWPRWLLFSLPILTLVIVCYLWFAGWPSVIRQNRDGKMNGPQKGDAVAQKTFLEESGYKAADTDPGSRDGALESTGTQMDLTVIDSTHSTHLPSESGPGKTVKKASDQSADGIVNDPLFDSEPLGNEYSVGAPVAEIFEGDTEVIDRVESMDVAHLDQVVNDGFKSPSGPSDSSVIDRIDPHLEEEGSIVNDPILGSSGEIHSADPYSGNHKRPPVASFNSNDPQLLVQVNGDPLLSGFLERELEDILARDRRRVFDKETATQFNMGQAEAGLNSDRLLQAANENGVDIVFLAEVIPLEEVERTVQGNRSRVFVAQIRVDALLPGSGKKLNLRCLKNVGYTPINAAEVAEMTVRGFRAQVRDLLSPENLKTLEEPSAFLPERTLAIFSTGNTLVAQPLKNTLARLLEKRNFKVLDDFYVEGQSQVLEQAGDWVRRQGGGRLITLTVNDLAPRKVYFNGSETLLTTSNIAVRCFDVDQMQKLGKGWDLTLEYSSLNAVEKVEETGKRLLRNLIRSLKSND